MERFGEWLGLDRAGVGHALRLALAAWLSFGLASVLHIQNAYWAAMPIWVVAQPSPGDAVAYAAGLLRADAGDQGHAAERRLLAEISDVETSARSISAGSIEGYRRLRHVDALVVASLSVMAAGVALQGRQRRGEQLPPELPDQLDGLAARLRSGVPRSGPDERITGWADSTDPVMQRLSRAVELLVETEAALFASPARADARSFGTKVVHLAPQQEWTMAWRIGWVTGGATFVASALGYASGLPDATLAAMGVSIFSMVLGSMAQPHVIAPKLLTGIVVGVTLATGYRLWLQPAITGTAAIFGSSAALLLSALIVAPAYMLARPSGGRALEAAAIIRRDLRRLLERKRAPEATEWQAQTSRQILRLTLHLGRAGLLQRRFPGGLVATLNLGHTIFCLRALARSPGLDADAVKQAFATLERFDEDPRRRAGILCGLAERVADPALARGLRDTAHALEQSARLLSFGTGEVRA